MEAQEFYDNVVQMRKNQKDYFKTRDRYYLEQSKKYERLIDAEIKRVEAKKEAEQRRQQAEDRRQLTLEI